MLRVLIILVFIIALVLPNTGCQPIYSGTVIDAETGKPVEGALAFAQWTNTQGLPGLTYHKVSALSETETDINGKFLLVGSFNPLADPPEVVVYKEGYTAWRNDYKFPTWEHRESVDTDKIILERFKEEFSLLEYSSFLNHGIMEKTQKFKDVTTEVSKDAYRRADIQIPLDFKGIVVDAETGDPIEGAIVLAMGTGLGYTPKVNTIIESISDKEGIVRITGNFPMLERPPSILVYKKGYFSQSSWHSGNWKIKELNNFKWASGYVFKMERWDSRFSHKEHFDFLYNNAVHAENEGMPLLMNSIRWEKDLK